METVYILNLIRPLELIFLELYDQGTIVFTGKKVRLRAYRKYYDQLVMGIF
ncbi:hypothetical protein AN618_24210 [Fervidicola ferrireducens]|uniref:Uncharacterized protein n=1 Tax=Fervidicola ferrireducens TaxID=520764 RepID=A0A140L0E1_9FIRM|nr:hypothetical protein AN618_24210 [Fervidicola ferrireducens]